MAIGLHNNFMSYTFTSPIKNYNNNETLNHCSEIKRKLNDIFDASETILMVGWRYDSDITFIKHVLDKGKKLTIVEIFEKNLENLPAGVTGVCADIRDYEVKSNFDLFLWQHGPEHVNKIDVARFFGKYGQMFKYIVLESPNGPNEQGAMYGNPYEEHISAWTPKDYEDLGFDYITYAGPKWDGFVLAYKVHENTIPV